MLCYSVKLPPAYFLKKIEGTQCILSFLPGCLRSYLIATALSQRAPAIFLFPTNRARGAVRHGGYFIPLPQQRCYDPSRDLKSQGKFRVTDFKGQSKLLKKSSANFRSTVTTEAPTHPTVCTGSPCSATPGAYWPGLAAQARAIPREPPARSAEAQYACASRS